MATKPKYDGRPLVDVVEIEEIPINPDDLGEGCKKIAVFDPPPEQQQEQ
jgi:hypothetical protein